MKTIKPAPSEPSTSRRAQPLRQTRNNPPRGLISSSRAFGARGSVSGGLEENPIDIFPAITHFADAITALPKEFVRHFTLLKEVDAKIFTPEEELGKLVEAALNAPLPQPLPPVDPQHSTGPTSAPMSTQGSVNGSVVNGKAASVNSNPDVALPFNSPPLTWDPVKLPRTDLFKLCAYTMQSMLVSLDEKNHVISTAAEALQKQLARIDDCFPYIELEVSEEAQFGSNTHWAYPENRVPKNAAGVSRREIASANNLSAAAQHLAEEAAARSDARKQALLERKKHKNQHAESDFDDHHDNRHKDKKAHGNNKGRKPADTPAVGLGITNGAATNGNASKRRKVEKGPTGGAVMERSLSAVFSTNGTKGKGASPRDTPVPEASKKRSRAAASTNGQSRKRNGTVSSAMSPSVASSPIRSTFPDLKVLGKPSPPPTNGGRPASIKAQQNSAQSILEKRAPSESSNKPNGNKAATPDPAATATVAGRSVTDAKTITKETADDGQEQMFEENDQEESQVLGGGVANRKETMHLPKMEELEANGDPMQGVQITTTTKSGRASKPSTPAMSSFPEPVRSRSQRNVLDNSSKRSHKKGAGAAAQLIARKNSEVDETTSNGQDEEEDGDIGEDEPTYCYCNNVSYGEMVGCDSDDCEREWFHLECVGLKVAPKITTKWYCDDCKEKMRAKRFNGR